MINKKEVKKIAALARVGLTEEEVEKFSKDLSTTLDWMDELKKADVSGAEPVNHITGLSNRTREDKVGEFGKSREIKKLFPEEKDGFDKVKSVL